MPNTILIACTLTAVRKLATKPLEAMTPLVRSREIVSPDAGKSAAWTNYAALVRVEGLTNGSTEWRSSAREKYLRAWEIAPPYLAAFGLATLAAEEQDWQVAEQWYQRAMEHNPLDLDSLYNRANALIQLGKMQEADSLCIEMIRLNPRDRGVLSLREQIKLRTSR